MKDQRPLTIALFCHSLLSDWNHGNAHFLRGVVSELARRGHRVRSYEPRDAWSVQNLVRDHGEQPLTDVTEVYPLLDIVRYETIDLDRALAGVDLVLMHEWNDPALVAAVGERRKRGANFRALFHDTHHRSVSAPDELARYDLSGYDGVLAFGNAVAEMYRKRGWGRRAWTWHEAADATVFHPPAQGRNPSRDLVWIGNWGDGERTAELRELLIEPSRDLQLSTRVHGVRYPDDALAALREANLEYAGWLPNYRVPAVFAEHRVTVHVPRRFYRDVLPGIPTIRPFEALACGIPLVSGPWADAEGLFRPGVDYLIAHNRDEMSAHLRALLADADFAESVARSGRETILARHTCAHRVDELLAIARDLEVRSAREHEATAL